MESSKSHSNFQFSNDQSGFLGLRSTVTSLLKNTDDWYNGLDLGKFVGLVFISLTLKRPLIPLIMKFYARSSRFMASSIVSFPGSNLT